MRLFGQIVFLIWASVNLQAQEDWCTPGHGDIPKIKNTSLIKPRSVLTIPIVFHIVWFDNSDNISDERIQSQLDVLNTDYRKLNSDLQFVPDKFKNLSADMEIEFCLASIDPNGFPTSGITRNMTTVENIGTENTVTAPYYSKIKYTSLGGVDGWDNEKYLNVWVGKFQENGGYLGQSTYPWKGLKSEDGIRIDPNYVGVHCINALKKKYSYGRTLTHEIGHYLGLLHPWDTSVCEIGDLVADTPPQKEVYYGCPGEITEEACMSIPMTMNFLEYTDDRCMAMFTKGQKARVDSILSIYRPLLLSQNIPCNTKTKDSVLTEANVKIYPNPTSTCLVLELGIEDLKEVQLQIWDISARLIYNETMPAIAIRPIEIGFVPKGMYIMKIISGSQSITRKIMVI
ncbi:MAG TPA: M43 family zinc metalloprotease [Saprospiraceae bacterium]|nr:M43 family zinc metalloprotease [Saprospiraceae bacterium]